ncbi:sigma-70 family RNA polymerase sigma factor [soil metagenome]
MVAVLRSAVATAPPFGADLAGRTDEDLVALAAKGRTGAVATLHDRHQAACYGLARRITGDQATAEDVVQEAFLGVWRNAASYSPACGPARTWLLSIVHHNAIDAVRRPQSTTTLSPENPPAQMIGPDLWSDMAIRLDAAMVRRAVVAMAPQQRRVIELAYFGGYTQQEIARLTSAPLGTVKSRARLGLLRLREALIAQGDGADRANDVPVRRPARAVQTEV